MYLTVFYNGEEVDVEVLSYYAGCPAKTYGPPEDCYPEEHPEIDFRVLSGRGEEDCDFFEDLYDVVLQEYKDQLEYEYGYVWAGGE